MQPLGETCTFIGRPVLVGLFDFKDYADIVCTVSEVLELPEREVHERLFQEALETGWNVTRAARAFGVTPHVFDERMEEFYKRTDAFVFECLVVHLMRPCLEIDGLVTQAIEGYFGGSRAPRVLVLGDGIGTDSLRFAAMGFDMTYFEFEGWSSRLADCRFRRQGLVDRITTIHRMEAIPPNSFDVVISREVLEHVNDPPVVIGEIWECLRDGGIAVITESFGRVESCFPTHLAANQRYNGRTGHLFVEAGFRLLRSFPDNRPLVFQKTSKSDGSRFGSLNDREDYVVRRFLGRVGRRALAMVRF